MTTKKLLKYLFISTIAIPVISSCSKDDVTKDITIGNGVLVLNEGKYGSNNASLTYYDFDQKCDTTDVFAIKNSRGLGDTGQDMIQYGSKIYLAVFGSSTLEIIDPKTCVSKKTISLVDNNKTPSYPRSLTCANGKVYIVLYNGTVAQLDTTTYSIEKTVAVGSNPDKSVIANNKLFVANTGAGKDSTVSVINLSTFTEEKKIKVNLNPAGNIGADSQGDVYVLSNGNYGNIPGKFQRIAAGTYEVTDIALNNVKGFTVNDNKAYIFGYTYDANYQAENTFIAVYNLATESLVTSNLIGTTIEKTPYGINVNPKTGDIYLGVTNYITTGKAYCFSADGSLNFTFKTGVSPNKFLFLYK